MNVTEKQVLDKEGYSLAHPTPPTRSHTFDAVDFLLSLLLDQRYLLTTKNVSNECFLSSSQHFPKVWGSWGDDKCPHPPDASQLYIGRGIPRAQA